MQDISKKALLFYYISKKTNTQTDTHLIVFTARKR